MRTTVRRIMVLSISTDDDAFAGSATLESDFWKLAILRAFPYLSESELEVRMYLHRLRPRLDGEELAIVPRVPTNGGVL